jgi:hypothetical protein
MPRKNAPNTMQQAVDNLATILGAIRRLERTADPSNVVTASHLDSLYLALKCQAGTVVEEYKLANVSLKIAN